jgi:hypothetical protein
MMMMMMMMMMMDILNNWKFNLSEEPDFCKWHCSTVDMHVMDTLPAYDSTALSWFLAAFSVS